MKKKTLIILILIFVLVIVGAVLLYNSLSAKLTPPSVIPPAANEPHADEKEQESVKDEPSSDQQEPSEDTSEPESFPAPVFTALDINGNEVELFKEKGRPAVLNFWASWCGPCKSEMPDFQEVYDERKDEIDFVMLNATDGSRETFETAKAYIEEMGYTMPVYFDTQFNGNYIYGIRAYPTTFFIDEEGNLFTYVSQAISKDILNEIIDVMLEN